MTSGLNPGISGEAIRKALMPEQVAAANRRDASVERATLDEAELQDLERAEYYSETPATVSPGATAAEPRRSRLDRLLRRGPR